MVEQDTVRLLRQCDAGVKMGIASIDDVLDKVRSEDMKHSLEACKEKHQTLEKEIRSALGRFHDEGKDPEPVAKGMSWMKTNVKLALNDSDATVADLITDGCNMGVKSLTKYLNQYKAADEDSKRIAKRLIKLEEDLVTDIQCFL